MNGIPLVLAFNCEVDATLPVGALAPGDVYRVANGTLVAAAELGLDTGPALVVARGIGDTEIANGREVIELVRDAVRKRDKARLRLLIVCFPFVALRVREVHAYLDKLRPEDGLRITGERKDQGPERHLAFQFACVRTLDALAKKRRVSIAKAAEELSRVCRPHQDARALRNMHSRLHPYLRLRTEGLYVPAGDLAPTDWSPSRAGALNPDPRKDPNMSRKQHTPNDQRSIVKNPNNPAYHADVRNREVQREAATDARTPPSSGSENTVTPKK